MNITREQAAEIVAGFEVADDEGQLNVGGYALLREIAEEFGNGMFGQCQWLLERANKP